MAKERREEGRGGESRRILFFKGVSHLVENFAGINPLLYHGAVLTGGGERYGERTRCRHEFARRRSLKKW